MKRQYDEDDEAEMDELRRQHPGKYSDIDDDEIWAYICKVAANDAGVTVERARAILEVAGQTADSHIGIVEAIETVLWMVRHKWLPPER